MLKEQYTFNLNQLKSFLGQLTVQNISEAVIEDFNNTYELKIVALTPISLYKQAEILEKRLKRKFSDDNRLSKAMLVERWQFRQKNLLFCTLIYYLNLKKISIQSITEKDLLPLKKIFLSKDISMLLFQAKHLLCKTSLSKNEWKQEDIERLKEIMQSKKDEFRNDQKSFKWKEVSFDIFKQSKARIFHSTKDCRQMWMNHLNPQLVKTTWSLEEDIELFTTINQLGCKWSLISKNMGRQRTEHMVKNRAKALIKRHFKKNVKMIENRHITAVLEALREKERHLSQQRQGQSSQDGTQKENPAQPQDQKHEENMESEGHYVDTASKKSNFMEIDEASYRLVLIQNMDDNWQYNEEAHSFDFFLNRQFKYPEDLQYPF